ncbi:DUF5667 domain-containing protein [Nocardioides mangrovi]|uniref:DUF5667 domain-containing protein n=1 Tax=Nocardioides mangrovi TaxID=2874580 RepID=A0ABS7UES9_9ACTN|nr:DUF5667 domain-containing protein [Nocardioides mangrovi]MBZ5739277.1 DUF5667 domain-containing protein [Nocardioides mangrovi]
MTWGMTAQRRADEFDARVEGRSTDRAHGASRDEALLTLVAAMRSMPEVHARPEFVTDLRARLMAEAETALVPADVSRLQLPQRHTRRERRIAALVGGIAIVGATTSVAVASQSALPGESLYPIKRAIESAQTTVSLDEGAKGSAMLGNASSRLDEARQLSERQDDEGRVAESLTAFADQATAAADLLLADYEDHGRDSSIRALREFAATSLTELEDLEPMIPYDARDELLAAAATLTRIDSDAASQCGACDAAPLATLSPALAGEQVAAPTIASSQVVAERHQGSGKHHQHGTKLPNVGSSDLGGPGSVSDPSAGTSPTADPSTVTDPLTSLANGLTGGATGGKDSSASTPRIPVVSDVGDAVGALLGGVVDSLTGQSSDKN